MISVQNGALVLQVLGNASQWNLQLTKVAALRMLPVK